MTACAAIPVSTSEVISEMPKAEKPIVSATEKFAGVYTGNDVTLEMMDVQYWIDKMDNPYKTVMNREEITAFNAKLKEGYIKEGFMYDLASLVLETYRCFGIDLGRNTGDQEVTDCKTVSGESWIEKICAVKQFEN